ncbi:hypothetical protein TSAR_012161 [Trichomalopsis sarcophagae]|uniref:Uncharacterized protein n=1 Tax=Trichomalopsis sarcophagae TaxID=543379 RepID=A0A232FL77_9HYME|nr:hypothetical protein TSAR_012161 [Trichomalopsis sarcophagae]
MWHVTRENVRRGARGRLLEDAVLASIRSKRPSLTNSSEEKSEGKHDRKRQRPEKAVMQRETLASRVPHNATEPPAQARPNKNKYPEGILVKMG